MITSPFWMVFKCHSPQRFPSPPCQTVPLARLLACFHHLKASILDPALDDVQILIVDPAIGVLGLRINGLVVAKPKNTKGSQPQGLGGPELFFLGFYESMKIQNAKTTIGIN